MIKSGFISAVQTQFNVSMSKQLIIIRGENTYDHLTDAEKLLDEMIHSSS